MVVRQPGTSIVNNPDINRLLSAAVISPNFCQLLLTDPEKALSSGFNGEYFHLSHEEHALVGAIRADDLADFARQLLSDPPLTKKHPFSRYTGSWQVNAIPNYAAV